MSFFFPVIIYPVSCSGHGMLIDIHTLIKAWLKFRPEVTPGRNQAHIKVWDKITCCKVKSDK